MKDKKILRKKENKFIRNYLKRWQKQDYFIFLIFLPAILILFYFLPGAIKSLFILNTKNPTFLSIFFSNYIHTDFSHLLNNLVGYLLIIFLLFNVETNRKMLYKISLSNFIILPFIISLSTIYFLPQLQTSQGFSAIVLAFTGYLLFSIFLYLKDNYHQKLNYTFLWLLLMINFTIWSIFSEIGFLLVLIPITLILLFCNRNSIKEILIQMKSEFYKLSRQNFIRRAYNILIFLLTFVFIFSLWKFLPTKIITKIGAINIVAHYLGYCFGVFVPILIEKLKR